MTMLEPRMPTPPRSQITELEQMRILRAALSELNPDSLAATPAPSDNWSLQKHIETVVLDSIIDTYAITSIPLLLKSMFEAADCEIGKIAEERGLDLSSERGD